MLTENEIERLKQAIIATVASPIIGSIEDYAWEAIFHYVKDIPLTDPALGRSKLLYDAVNFLTKTGWSLKSLQLSNLKISSTFFFVIQRADVISKADQLGFPGLTELSPPEQLGAAIIQHWNEKLITNQSLQGVENSYESILLKTIKGNEYVYCEYPLYPLDPTTFNWAWTVNKKTGKSGAGLQGSAGDKIELVWYKNQKQLFKARIIPSEAVRINIERTRLNPENYVKTILAAVQAQNS
ncbi:hypothetical protein PN478_19010 [Dolichospermum circinale CS-534/05]|uniref:hypothetical protein n=1 Tax=Dolichospermum circinale TaxID=109265 RepID=UPI0023309343|nr:hypothetical protein [Dolichospermum circinale]MDB9454068.1 hypothetical protein [Dolichospermum circinale CS-541/06]MDB9461004.1 hypothetical protein [Dolichospermum circinale CS-541/04]MDB9492597.1 hypothetical protein [Dolichospermum circinale CS-534/05]MDB9545852.1 hypothetical protein [Dolichospermum circinale CS-1031]